MTSLLNHSADEYLSELNPDCYQPIRLLLVDDEISVLNTLKRAFRSSDYLVSFATSGEMAISLLEEHSFDVIISDMRMPKMNGARLLSIVAERWPDTSRIILTGYSGRLENQLVANKAKIFRYLSKPWDIDEIKQVVVAAYEFNHNKNIGS